MTERNFTNRGEPVPVLKLNDEQPESSSSATGPRELGKRDRLKNLNSQATARLREKLDSLESKKTESPKGMQDRLMNLLLQQVIPTDPGDNGEIVDKRSRKYVERPNFSLPTMSTNFRRFNARIGVAFVFQNQLERLFSWKQPTQTLSFLAIYSFVCLDPHTLCIIPLALLLYFVMLPSFLTRHPPPPSLPPTNLYPLSGPPLAPAIKIKPTPELSRDFFYNMRDLQNSMEDMTQLHDAIVTKLAPITNFSSEELSTTVFIALFSSCMVLFLTAHLIPWKYIALLGGWALVVSAHPTIQELLDTPDNQKAVDDQTKSMDSRFRQFASTDITLDPMSEKREVEVFELQYRPLHADYTDEWDPMIFTPAPYTPLSPARISGDRPKGTRFFEDVEPPRGWKWVDKKWTLDLLAKEWVEERCITGVEVEVEGERWVYDVLKEEEDEEGFDVPRADKKGYRYGEWRRRRWIRAVERTRIENHADD